MQQLLYRGTQTLRQDVAERRNQRWGISSVFYCSLSLIYVSLLSFFSIMAEVTQLYHLVKFNTVFA